MGEWLAAQIKGRDGRSGARRHSGEHAVPARARRRSSEICRDVKRPQKVLYADLLAGRKNGLGRETRRAGLSTAKTDNHRQKLSTRRPHEAAHSRQRPSDPSTTHHAHSRWTADTAHALPHTHSVKQRRPTCCPALTAAGSRRLSLAAAAECRTARPQARPDHPHTHSPRWSRQHARSRSGSPRARRWR